jgi:hypothetical protein
VSVFAKLLSHAVGDREKVSPKFKSCSYIRKRDFAHYEKISSIISNRLGVYILL